MAVQHSSVQAYRQTSVKTATQGKIIVMLYDEAIRQLDTAIGLLADGSKQLDLVNNAVVKAQDVITELMVSLDMEQGGDIAQNLFRLYMFFNQQLMDGNMRKELEPISSVRKFMGELREAWKQIETTAVERAAQPQTSGLNIAG